MTAMTTATNDVTLPNFARWRHALYMGVYAFVATFAATASVGTVVASLLTGSFLVATIVLLGCGVIAAVLGALTTFGAYRIHLESQRRSSGQCPRCGYDLRESLNRCPECGVAFARRAIRTPTAPPLPRRQIWA